MEKHDYFLRQIEQLGRVLGKILADLTGLKNQGKVHEQFDFTSAAFLNELDVDFPGLVALPEEELISMLTSQAHWNSRHLESFADILLELADGFEGSGNKKRADSLYRKALLIYRHLDESGDVFSLERYHKLYRILKRK